MHCAKLPYQIFPGIFSSIDSYTKKVTNAHFEEHQTLPEWLSEFGEVEEVVRIPYYSNFYIIDKNTNVLLSGIPDEILKMKDGSYFIIDYKTAKYTGRQDELLPMYKVQLNGYAYIAEKNGLSPIKGIALVYMEPVTNIDIEDFEDILMRDGFLMPFTGKILRLELKTNQILPLLSQARELYDLSSAPEGIPGCEDCRLLDELIEITGKK